MPTSPPNSRPRTRATSPRRATRRKARSARRSKLDCGLQIADSRLEERGETSSLLTSTNLQSSICNLQWRELMRTGVLLIQLGTPEAPTATALRPYLRQFLSDPRVIEVPGWKWWWILNLFILPFRPAASAAKYARIWDRETGSPLPHNTRRPGGGVGKT